MLTEVSYAGWIDDTAVTGLISNLRHRDVTTGDESCRELAF